jgi:hypothetical protein
MQWVISPALDDCRAANHRTWKAWVEVSRRSLFDYQKIDPGEAPAGFNDVSAWESFIRERQVYEHGRTQSTEKREAKERRAMSWDARQPAKRKLGNGDSDAEKYSSAAERKERILRLRLSNEMRRSKLERLTRNTVTIVECEAAMERIRAAVSGEVLKLPASLCDQLAGRNPQHIQEMLNVALRSSLERLSLAKTYLSAQSC